MKQTGVLPIEGRFDLDLWDVEALVAAMAMVAALVEQLLRLRLVAERHLLLLTISHLLTHTFERTHKGCHFPLSLYTKVCTYTLENEAGQQFTLRGLLVNQ